MFLSSVLSLVASLDFSSGEFSGCRSIGDVGDHSVVLKVMDSGGLTSEQSFTVTVDNVNDAPTFTS